MLSHFFVFLCSIISYNKLLIWVSTWIFTKKDLTSFARRKWQPLWFSLVTSPYNESKLTSDGRIWTGRKAINERLKSVQRHHECVSVPYSDVLMLLLDRNVHKAYPTNRHQGHRFFLIINILEGGKARP